MSFCWGSASTPWSRARSKRAGTLGPPGTGKAGDFLEGQDHARDGPMAPDPGVRLDCPAFAPGSQPLSVDRLEVPREVVPVGNPPGFRRDCLCEHTLVDGHRIRGEIVQAGFKPCPGDKPENGVGRIKRAQTSSRVGQAKVAVGVLDEALDAPLSLGALGHVWIDGQAIQAFALPGAVGHAGRVHDAGPRRAYRLRPQVCLGFLHNTKEVAGQGLALARDMNKILLG